MLILTRSEEEVTVLTIPGFPPVRVKVCAINGHRVRIGFDADTRIGIAREELMKNDPNYVPLPAG